MLSAYGRSSVLSVDFYQPDTIHADGIIISPMKSKILAIDSPKTKANDSEKITIT